MGNSEYVGFHGQMFFWATEAVSLDGCILIP